MRASRERERERACERVSELARSLAKNLKSSSSRSLARRKIEVAQLALARSRKFSPIFCTLTQPTGRICDAINHQTKSYWSENRIWKLELRVWNRYSSCWKTARKCSSPSCLRKELTKYLHRVRGSDTVFNRGSLDQNGHASAPFFLKKRKFQKRTENEIEASNSFLSTQNILETLFSPKNRFILRRSTRKIPKTSRVPRSAFVFFLVHFF